MATSPLFSASAVRAVPLLRPPHRSPSTLHASADWSRNGRAAPGARRSLCSNAPGGTGTRFPEPKMLCSPSALAPFFWLVTHHMVRNQVRSGTGLRVFWENRTRRHRSLIIALPTPQQAPPARPSSPPSTGGDTQNPVASCSCIRYSATRLLSGQNAPQTPPASAGSTSTQPRMLYVGVHREYIVHTPTAELSRLSWKCPTVPPVS